MMNQHKMCIVITSIHEGGVIDGYCRQAEKEGVLDTLRVIVIPDRKSPETLYRRCEQLSSKGLSVTCPDISAQEFFLKKFPGLYSKIPYNSDNRRNVGFLMALEWGCDALISLDDDNYCLEGNPTYQEHAVVCADSVSLPAVYSDNGWFNLCELLETEPASYPVYPRGFPYSKRHRKTQVVFREEKGSIRLNAGLWLESPDVDALSWLAAPVRAKTFKGPSLLLGQGTWSPINTQNTALHRDLIVAYYFVRMGYPLSGMVIDRYGDIFSGYLCQACVRHMGHRIRVGTPVAAHRRNAHNYFQDLKAEMACIWMLEDFLPWLREVELEGDSYTTTYLSLAEAIDAQTERFKGSIWTEDARSYLHEMVECMREWARACQSIGELARK